MKSQTPPPMRLPPPLLFIFLFLFLLLLPLLPLHQESPFKREQKKGAKTGVNMRLGGGGRRRENDQRDPPFHDKGAPPRSGCGSQPPKTPSHTQVMTPTPKKEEEEVIIIRRQRGESPRSCSEEEDTNAVVAER